MSTLKRISVNVPAQLFELGLTEAQLQEQINQWLVISLFRQGKITAAEASQMLASDTARFLTMLDRFGISREPGGPLEDLPASRSHPLTPSVTADGTSEALNRELALTKEKLAQAQKQLHEAERLQSEFLATVSHELRTPLNSILGFAKLLLNQTVGPLNKIQHTDISFIYDSAQHLLSLVNDILDLSKINAGKIRLDMEWLTVEEIIVGVMASTYILIEGKPIDLKEEIEPGLPQIYVDRGRIRQVVLNLLSNAAKFTNTGCIMLNINQMRQGAEAFICFSVTDTGIGIAEKDIDKVFEAFRQIDSSDGRRAEGTGLGMPISRRLVELHGGKLWLQSKVGQGSTFYFTIPLKPPRSVQADVVHGDYNLEQ
jgi:signal transduction histidine kinase